MVYIDNYQKQITNLQKTISQNINIVKPCYFIGPAEYFSQEALKECRLNFLSDRHIEMVYATLVSWGMHWLGVKGPKMPDFNKFKKSIFGNKTILMKLKNLKIENLSKQDLAQVIILITELIFGANGIKGSATKSLLVAGSKVLAHILPDLIPPIDNKYTSKFFNFSLTNKLLLEVVLTALWEVYQDKKVRSNAITYNKTYPYVSLPKLFDNVIIYLIKNNIAKKNPPSKPSSNKKP